MSAEQGGDGKGWVGLETLKIETSSTKRDPGTTLGRGRFHEISWKPSGLEIDLGILQPPDHTQCSMGFHGDGLRRYWGPVARA